MIRLLSDWSLAPQAVALFVALLVLAAAYLHGAHRLRRFERSWPRWRSAALLAGIAAIEVAMASPLRLEARTSPPVQVTQALLLLDLAPSLIALSAPVALLLESARLPLRRRVGRALGGRLARALSHPAVVLACFVTLSALDLAGPLGAAAARHPVIGGVTQAALLAVGYGYWSQALGQDPLPRRSSEPVRLLLVGATIPPGSLLGILLLDASRPLLPGGGVAATHVSGAIVWSVTDLYALVALALVFTWWMRAEDRSDLDEVRTLDPVLEAERIVAAAAERGPRHGAGSTPDGGS